MNHNSSSATPLQNTRFVVNKGILLSRKEKRMLHPNNAIVPTPVLSSLADPDSIMALTGNQK
jgi:hypothetical protein